MKLSGLRSNGNEKKWGDRRDSNPQQPESQSGALPLNYGHHQGRVGYRIRLRRVKCRGVPASSERPN